MKYICYNWMPTIADHILDLPEGFYNSAGTSRLHNVDDFDTYRVLDNDTIFVKTDFIINGSFARLFLNKIPNRRFNLITGISSYHLGRDDNDGYKYILDHPMLNKWICTNPPPEHSDKIIPIPIGFEEPDRPGGNQKMLDTVFQMRTPFEQKKDKIFLPYHNVDTNTERRELISRLGSLPFIEVQKEKQNLEEYYSSLDEYKFVIGLEGRGPDIHRNYESMLVGSIPINKRNVIESVYDFYGVETEFIDDWEELNEQRFNDLLKKNYNTKSNDKFLQIESIIDRVKKEISF
jgi:hypothetical protein